MLYFALMCQTLLQMERWYRPGCQTTCSDIEVVDLGAKPGCLKFLNKTDLDRIPVVEPLMMIEMRYKSLYRLH